MWDNPYFLQNRWSLCCKALLLLSLYQANANLCVKMHIRRLFFKNTGRYKWTFNFPKNFHQTSFSPYSPNFLPLYFLKSFHIGFSTGYIQCTFVMFLWNSKHVWLKRKSSLKLLLRVIYKVTLPFYHLINAFDYLKYFMCMDFCILHINENHSVYTDIILLPIWL